MKRLLLVMAIIATVFSEIIVKQNGDSLNLGCQDTGGTITWKRDSDPDPTTEGVQSVSSGSNWNSTLKRENVTVADAGSYICYKPDGSVISNYTVTIISLSGESAPLVVNTSSIDLTCTVDNTNIKVTSIAWKRNGVQLNTTEKYGITRTNNSHSSTITINKPVAEDAGVYNCVVTVENMEKEFHRVLSLDTPPVVRDFEKLRSKVEGETAMIVCNVSGYPIPHITWYRKLEDQEEVQKITYDERVNASTNADNVPNAVLMINKLKIKTDRGDYSCEATNALGTDKKAVSLKVKDKLAAVWPFLGICAEVAILCSVIFIFEKRRNRRMEEEEEVDAVKHNLMNQSNGNDEVRQRSSATKA